MVSTIEILRDYPQDDGHRRQILRSLRSLRMTNRSLLAMSSYLIIISKTNAFAKFYFHNSWREKVAVNFNQLSIETVSARWLGLILFLFSQSATSVRSSFKPLLRLLMSCLRGWLKPALTILLKSFKDFAERTFLLGIILRMAPLTFGRG